MRKIFTLALLLAVQTLSAQGVYQLWGMTQSGGSNGNGAMFSTDSAANNFQSRFQFPDATKGSNSYGKLTLANNKFYGMAENGGKYNVGVIFEYDPSTNIYTNKFDFDTTNGRNPSGSLTLYNGLLYGMAQYGGVNKIGVIFQYDPVNNIFTKRFDFGNGSASPMYYNGGFPLGNLTLVGSQFYGLGVLGGTNGKGVFFQWDPSPTNAAPYTKIDFTGTANGANPNGSLIQSGNFLYGMTMSGGKNSLGVIFQYNLTTGILVNKFNFAGLNGSSPEGSLTTLGSYLYGITKLGGSTYNTNGIASQEIQGQGVLFQYLPGDTAVTKLVDLSSSNGNYPLGSLTMSNSKLYGMTYSGGNNTLNGLGEIFEYDTTAKSYNKKKTFLGTDGQNPDIGNDFTRLPAPVAKGVAGSCISLNGINISTVNNNQWVAITDSIGDVVAEINAGGNKLGLVNTNLFINKGKVRQDYTGKLYLDRNITITPTVQPLALIGPVKIRLYLKNTELLALQNSTDSAGSPSGINSINDLGIFQNTQTCAPKEAGTVTYVATTDSAWQQEYVLTATVTTLNSFYFANKALFVLPLNFVSFTANLVNGNAALNWVTNNEANLMHTIIERSINGIDFTAIGTVNNTNFTGNNNYRFIDLNVNSLNTQIAYYRLKQVDISNGFTYSGITSLTLVNMPDNTVRLYPNPVTSQMSCSFNLTKSEQVEGRVIDNSGKLIKQFTWNIIAGSTTISTDLTNISAGNYHLDLKGTTIAEHLQFIKK